VQSVAIARWAARKSDLYPTNDVEQLIVDEIMETMSELLIKTGQHSDPEVKKKMREDFVATTLPRFLNHVASRVAQSGGPYVLGKKLSVADLFVFAQLNSIYTDNVDYVPADIIPKKFPAVHKLYTDIEKHDIVRAELEAAQASQN
jgi:glutathione S-transferase